MKRDQILTNNTANKNWNITEALNKMKRKGYTLEFRREASCIYCIEWQQWIMPANFMIDESYYFEEIANPDVERMLYAISLSQGGKGFLIDTCTVYMDNISPEMMQKLEFIKTKNNRDDLTKVIQLNSPIELINEVLAF